MFLDARSDPALVGELANPLRSRDWDSVTLAPREHEAGHSSVIQRFQECSHEPA